VADAVISPIWGGQERKRAGVPIKCPMCGEMFRPGVEEQDVLKADHFPYRHVLLHGTPLHAVITYIDANFTIRAVEGAHSVEVARGASTLQEILRKWANPS
jgi:hypothetical protein